MAGEAFDKAIKKLSEKDVDRWLHYFEKNYSISMRLI